MRNPPDVPGVRSQRTRFQKLLAYLKRYWFLYLLVLPGFGFIIVFNYGTMPLRTITQISASGARRGSVLSISAR